MAYPSTWSRKISHCIGRLWKSGLKKKRQTTSGSRYKEKYVILLSLVTNRVQMLQCLAQFIQDFFFPCNVEDFISKFLVSSLSVLEIENKTFSFHSQSAAKAEQFIVLVKSWSYLQVTNIQQWVKSQGKNVVFLPC